MSKTRVFHSQDVVNNQKLTTFGFREEKYFCDECGFNNFVKVEYSNVYICNNCGKEFENRDHLKIEGDKENGFSIKD